MAWLVFILTLLITVAKMTDFLIGRAGNRKINARLADFYFSIQRDWEIIYQMPAERCAEFLDHLLSFRAFVQIIRIALIIALPTAALMLVSESSEGSHPWFAGTGSTQFTMHARGLFLTGNLVGFTMATFASWHIARWFLRKMAGAGPRDALLCIALLSSISLSCIVMGAVVAQTVATISSERTLYDFTSRTYIVDDGAQLALVGINDYINVLVLLPSLLVSLLALGSLCLFWFWSALRRPLMVVLERLEERGENTLTAIAIGIAGIAGLVTTYLKAAGS